ncbi:MAG: histidine phosphatase family protein [Sphingopyxis sp.]|nr:histidine phosphatase family protein [Sphingopyxis sp.]
MTGTIVLVRHTEVALSWKGRCYGISDVPLSRAGKTAATRLSIELAARRPAWVMHSGLVRARLLAEQIAARAGSSLQEGRDWRERDFGTWEGLSWTSVYRASGNAMDGMIDAPGVFRPGGGETTNELADRVAAAWERLPAGDGIVVTHGGPIAAILGRRSGKPVVDWLALAPPYGGYNVVPRRT